jgi:hypothetical protein
MRGGRKPWVSDCTSSLAEAFGVVVPIPTCESPNSGHRSETSKSVLINLDFGFFAMLCGIVFVLMNVIIVIIPTLLTTIPTMLTT